MYSVHTHVQIWEVQPLSAPLRLNLLFFSRPEQCGGECWHVNFSSEEQCSRVNLRPISGLSLFHINAIAMIGVKMGRTRLYIGAGDMEQACGKLPMCVSGEWGSPWFNVWRQNWNDKCWHGWHEADLLRKTRSSSLWIPSRLPCYVFCICLLTYISEIQISWVGRSTTPKSKPNLTPKHILKKTR